MFDGSGRRWVLSACAALAAVLVASSTNAQRLTASYGVAHSGHRLIGTLGGYDLQLTGQRLGLVSVAGSFGRHRGSHLRTGVACVGLIRPGDSCPTEQLRDQATMTEVAGTLDVALFRQMISGAVIEGTAAVGIQALQLRSSSRGQVTGNQIEAERTRFGPSFGFEMTARPKRAIPVGVSLGISGGAYGDTQGQAIDGYAPFEEGFSVTRVEVGLVVFIRT
jgi:hypothetical protein